MSQDILLRVHAMRRLQDSYYYYESSSSTNSKVRLLSQEWEVRDWAFEGARTSECRLVVGEYWKHEKENVNIQLCVLNSY